MAGCTIAYQIWGYIGGDFTSLNQWRDYNNCSNCLSYIIKTFSTTTGAAEVESTGTMLVANDLKPQTILDLKIVTRSVFSRTATKQVEDFFLLKMRQSPCVDNRLAFDPTGAFVYANHYGTEPVKDYEYLIGTPVVQINPKYSTVFTTTACPLTAWLYILDEQTNQWVDKTTSLPTWIPTFEPTKTAANIAAHMTI